MKSLHASKNEEESKKSTSNEAQLDDKSKSLLEVEHPDDEQKKDSDSNDNSEDDKQKIMKRMKSRDVNPAKELELQGQRTVKDPVTNSDVIISDSQFDITQGLSCCGNLLHSLGHVFRCNFFFFWFCLSSLPKSFTFSPTTF
jgi:hypothetical protein